MIEQWAGGRNTILLLFKPDLGLANNFVVLNGSVRI